MNQIVVISFAALSILCALSCTNSNAKENKTKHQSNRSQVETDNSITFKVNGQLVKTSGWTISRFKLVTDAKPSLNITTDMHIEKRTLNINLESAEPGTYTVKSDPASNHHFYGSYYPDYIKDLTSSYSFEGGSFTITEIDTGKNVVNGFFSGVVKNLKGESFNITDGKIVNGTLTPGVTKYE
jgi:hypothetical protein